MGSTLDVSIYGSVNLRPRDSNKSNRTNFFGTPTSRTVTKFQGLDKPMWLYYFSCNPLMQNHQRYSVAQRNSVQQTALLVEKYHEQQRLQSLLQKLSKKGSCPLQILRDDGDWSEDQFWVVIKLLKHSSRSRVIPQVFDMWKLLKPSRINKFNYEKIVRLLCDEGLMEEAVTTFQEIKKVELRCSLEIYNSMVHGFANKGNFNDAYYFLNEMKEMELGPDTDTYDGLIQAYGKYKMYDEMGMCVKRMELDGCPPDHVTYNLLIRNFARAGLLQKMEKIRQTLFSKKMYLQPSTLISMLEAYANFGILDKMDKAYKRVLKSKMALREDTIRKLAEAYIDNHMFSRLEELGQNHSASDCGDLCWCLRLLSHACLLSKKGMHSVIQEMDEAKVPWNPSLANTMLLAYSKMKHFKELKMLFFELPVKNVKPDIVTVGVLFDSKRVGFDGSGILTTWRRQGFLYRSVEMETDPLVLRAFRKGHFLKCCEDIYSSLESETPANSSWTYESLIDLVLRHWSHTALRNN